MKCKATAVTWTYRYILCTAYNSTSTVIKCKVAAVTWTYRYILRMASLHRRRLCHTNVYCVLWSCDSAAVEAEPNMDDIP